MENLTAVACSWLSMLVLVQSAVFIWSSRPDHTLWTAYVKSWARTLRMLKRLVAVGDSARDGRDSVSAAALLALCLPGAVLVLHALSRMAG